MYYLTMIVRTTKYNIKKNTQIKTPNVKNTSENLLFDFVATLHLYTYLKIKHV